MACHYMDLPFWALDLRYPTSVRPQGPPPHAETAPEWIAVRWEFPARGEQPPVTLTWTDGGKLPPILEEKGMPRLPGSGVLFKGDKGMLFADYDRKMLLPESDFRDYKPPEPSIPPSIGHHAEWIAACKDGRPTTCNFGYSGALTETVLLGVVAYRSGTSGKIAWSGAHGKITDNPKAEALLHREYRKGWTL